MGEKIFQPVLKAFYKDRFVFLIILILAMMLFAPFLMSFIRLRLFMDVCFSVMFIAGIYAFSQKKHHLIFGVIFAIPMLLAVWSQYFVISKTIITIGNICGVCFFAFAAIIILKYIFSAQEVNLETISAAIVVYLLMAVLWSFIYIVLDTLYPESFAISTAEFQSAPRFIFLYYSFVTITTLGYGDITPLGVQAKSLAVIEAITGQMYLVVVVAWLVGMFVSKKSK
jgi:hypothetical protein